MRRMGLGVVLIFCVALCLASPLAAAVSEQQQKRIDEMTGAKGVYTQAEDVYKVSFPRTDVKVTIEGRPMPPFLGLTSWAAFTSDPHGQIMVMGDLVLFPDEVNPVMSAALENGLEVTALHNHFLFDEPRVMFMHIGGHGTAEALASAVRKVLDAVRSVRSAAPVPAARFSGPQVPESNSINAGALDGIFGIKGLPSNGMYKATFGRKTAMHGLEVGNQMGINTWAAFAGTDDNTVVDGDFVMLKSEVQAVLKSLRRSGINIVAIHNHMIGEEPQLIFLHFWGKGPATTLARALKAAMDTQKR